MMFYNGVSGQPGTCANDTGQYSRGTDIKTLFINSHSADYVQDLTYSGLVKVLGKDKVVDYRWNKKYHVPYKKYPKNLGYTPGSLFSSLFNRRLDDIDLLIVGASKVDCFETYIEVADRIPASVTTVFVDGGDRSDIGEDLTIYGRPELYQQALAKRPFDIVFKREYNLDRRYDDNVYPLPISFNMDRLPGIPAGYRYDVSFWAVETDPIRTHALELLEDKYDCEQNGTVRNQKFSKYKRKGQFYLQELAQCRIVLNFRGGGWDTMRYWEVPAVGTFMMTQKPGILIPDDFVAGRDVVHVDNDLEQLIDLCDYYLKHEAEREKIAASGRDHLLRYHTDVARAEFLLSKLPAS